MAQQRCAGAEYQQETLQKQPALAGRLTQLETWIQEGIAAEQFQRTQHGTLIVPVVFHNLYHLPSEKITEQQVQDQLKTLNECFRKRNADTVNTRPVFKSFAAG